MKHEEVLINNYLSSVKMVQRSVYLAFLINAFIYLIIEFPQEIVKLKIPIIGVELDTPKFGLIALVVLYFLNGLFMSFSTRTAIKNKNKISNIKMKESLVLYPLVLTSEGGVGAVVFTGLVGLNFIIYLNGLNFDIFYSVILGAITAIGYFDSYYNARANLASV